MNKNNKTEIEAWTRHFNFPCLTEEDRNGANEVSL
jgi:hypothetical protein